MLSFAGAKKRKAKETTAVVAAESTGGESTDKPQIQVFDADDDEEDGNTYRRKTVCIVIINLFQVST